MLAQADLPAATTCSLFRQQQQQFSTPSLAFHLISSRRRKGYCSFGCCTFAYWRRVTSFGIAFRNEKSFLILHMLRLRCQMSIVSTKIFAKNYCNFIEKRMK